VAAVAHVVDFLVFAAVLYLTYSFAGPFFLVFAFAVLSATLNWSWRGALITTGLAMAFLIPIGVTTSTNFTGHGIDVARFMSRIGSMLAVAGLLIAFGRHQERVERDLLRLFGPPLRPEPDERPPIEMSLRHAVEVFAVAGGQLIWGDPEEPELMVSRLDRGRFYEAALPIAPGAPVTSLPAFEAPFVYNTRDRSGFFLADGKPQSLPQDVARHPLLANLVDDEAVILPIRATSFLGWVILPKAPYLARESVMLGVTVAAQLSVAVESWRSMMTWRDAAAASARVRLSRDLHDGILQFLTGAALQLDALRRELGPRQTVQRERLAKLQDDLTSEQRHLRELITRAEPVAPVRPSAWVDFASDLDRLCAVLRRQWGIAIELDPATPPRRVATGLGFELLQIVREAVSNAVRHGGARTVRVRFESRAQALLLTLADDGCGLPQSGEFSLEDLNRLALGPRSLRARIAQLGGELHILSSPEGATLQVSLPDIHLLESA
jgi:signal transduction histidine kinase